MISDDNAVISSDKKVIIERAVSLGPMFTNPYMAPGYRPTDPQRMTSQQTSYYGTKPPNIPTTTTTTGSSDNRQLSYQEIQKYFVDAKYFMIKSSNYYNIERSIMYGEWATTKNNEVLFIFPLINCLRPS